MKTDDTPLIPIKVSARALGRAQLLVQEMERRRDLYGSALNATPEAIVPAPLGAADAGDDHAQAGAVVNRISQVSDQRLLATHDRLQKAGRMANERAAQDPEVLRLQQAIYGGSAVAAPDRAAAQADVIDVQAVQAAALPEPPGTA